MTTSDASSRVPGVYQCIVAVSRDIAADGISKSRSNPQQGYQFRGIDDVLNALAPLLAKHGLVMLPRCLSRQVTERQTKNGGVLFSVTLEAEYDFICAADGSMHTVRVFGEAMDSADKATNKAMSAAYKYAAVQTFCIPTEGDHDADATTHDVAATPAPQQSAIPPAGERENPAGATGETRATSVNTETGEERPTPPRGYVYIDSYLYKNGWHDVRVAGTRYSTKQAIGLDAREAFENGWPVKIDSSPKQGTKGDHWLNQVTIFRPMPPQTSGDDHTAPLTDDEIPF